MGAIGGALAVEGKIDGGGGGKAGKDQVESSGAGSKSADSAPHLSPQQFWILSWVCSSVSACNRWIFFSAINNCGCLRKATVLTPGHVDSLFAPACYHFLRCAVLMDMYTDEGGGCWFRICA